ncbi:MAG: glycosyltransferase [Bacteroidota bacterium]
MDKEPVIHTTSNQTKTICLLVMGMHRSGTSAFAGLLHECGIPMGEALMVGGYDNPLGFFEDEQVVALNDEILALLGQDWDSIDDLPNNWWQLAKFQKIKKKIVDYLKKVDESQGVFAFKYPRLSLTFPLWQSVFEQLNMNVCPYILVRHPYEVAASLQKRNNFTQSQSTALWLKYMLSAERNTRDWQRQFVSYESLLEDTNPVLKKIESTTAKSLHGSVLFSRNNTRKSIQTKLRHHQITTTIKNEALAASFAAFSKLTDTPADDAILSTLDTIQNGDWRSSFVLQPNHFATFEWGRNYQFNQFPKSFQPIEKGEQNWTIELPINKGQSPNCVRFYPTNTQRVVELYDVAVLLKNGELQSLPTILEKATPTLSDKKQSIDLELPNGTAALKVWINYLEEEAVNTPIAAFQKNSVKSQTKRPNFWWSFVKTSLQSPWQFLKNINLDNLRTLQKALMNEPPSLILRNLRNLLLGSQVTAEKSSDKRKELTNNTINQLSQPIGLVLSKNKIGRILYLTTDLPEYDRSSGGKRATRLLGLLSEQLDVVIYVTGNCPEQYADFFTKKGIIVVQGIDPQDLKAQFTEWTAIICATFATVQEGRQVQVHYPSTQLIVDMVDVHWVREERSIGIVDGLTVERVAKNKIREVAAYRQSDQIWAVTEVDKQAILKEIPDATVRVVSNIHDPIITEFQAALTPQLLFIGSYKHLPNISAAMLLANEIFPKVQQQIPNVSLVLAGTNMPEAIKKLGQQEGIILKEFVPESEMPTLYQQTQLTVTPLLTGAGIKGKICESIVYATPVVTNAIGNEGIDLVHGEEGLIGDIAEIPNLIVDALQGKYNLGAMTRRAQSKLANLVGSIAVNKNALTAIFPTVSICIVTWNKLAFLKKCIDYVLKNTHYPNYKILVHSNGCTDGTAEYLQAISKKDNRIIPILSEQNEVFVRPNNRMMQRYSDHDVVLLNNDAWVTKNWLLELHRAAYAQKNIGIVGAKVLYPDGRLQEFGAELYANGLGNNLGKGASPDEVTYQKVQSVGYVSGCAMYIKRNTIDQIGVFDDRFHPCYYEDSDYCYTAKENDLLTVVTPHSIIYHEEGGTAGTNTASGFKKYQQINAQKFVAKHRGKENGIEW